MINIKHARNNYLNVKAGKEMKGKHGCLPNCEMKKSHFNVEQIN